MTAFDVASVFAMAAFAIAAWLALFLAQRLWRAFDEFMAHVEDEMHK